MMGNIWKVMLLLAPVLAGCGNAAFYEAGGLLTNPETQLVQTKELNGVAIRMTYLPQGLQQDEWMFTLTVNEPDSAGKRKETRDMNYGLDTLFHLVHGPDTISALHAMRVANGNVGGIQYMVAFPQIAAPDGDIRLVFSDWLFTGRYLEFPLSVPSIKKLDSLSARL